MKNTTRIPQTLFEASLSPARFRARTILLAAAVLLLLLSTRSTTFAGSATWKANPSSGDWKTAANWMPPSVPNGPADTATFATSNQTSVSTSANTEVNGIVFNSGASAFTVTVPGPFQLTIGGVGITNNSGITQNFVTTPTGFTAGGIIFADNATAGSQTVFTNTRNVNESGATDFSDNSTAGNGTFINNGGETSFRENSTAGNGTFINNGGETVFTGNSTAGNGTFTNNGGVVSGAAGGVTLLRFDTTAGNGTFTNNGGAVHGAGGGSMVFIGGRADNARLIANGGPGKAASGKIVFFGTSRGGTARVEVFGNGNLDISQLSAPGVTVGSIEGDGDVYLGSRNLTVGSNHLSTNFSGVIQDGGINGGIGGSLTKIGTGKLVLRHRNNYTGGTTVRRGAVTVNNVGGSGTGPGPVQVEGGKLGGKGIIAGAVTIGTGSGLGANLSPGYLHGAGRAGALTINSALTFNADGTYQAQVNSTTSMADEVAALGITINTGAQFSFTDLGSGTLPIGTVLTLISNTSANPIAGTFGNLADGSTFTSNGNTFKVNYQGGDGNDLTLRVVP